MSISSIPIAFRGHRRDAHPLFVLSTLLLNLEPHSLRCHFLLHSDDRFVHEELVSFRKGGRIAIGDCPHDSSDILEFILFGLLRRKENSIEIGL